MGGGDYRDFLDAITTVDILTASSFGVQPDKKSICKFCLTTVSSLSHFDEINKLARCFLHWQLLSTVCLVRNRITRNLSHQSLRACKDGGYHGGIG